MNLLFNIIFLNQSAANYFFKKVLFYLSFPLICSIENKTENGKSELNQSKTAILLCIITNIYSLNLIIFDTVPPFGVVPPDFLILYV